MASGKNAGPRFDSKPLPSLLRLVSRFFSWLAMTVLEQMSRLVQLLRPVPLKSGSVAFGTAHLVEDAKGLDIMVKELAKHTTLAIDAEGEWRSCITLKSQSGSQESLSTPLL